MQGFWVSTEVFIDDIEGYLWGESEKIWSKLSPEEQWDCFDWLCDTMTLEHDTGDIDEAIVDWFKSERGNSVDDEADDDDDDDDEADEGRCRREARRLRFRKR